MLRVGLTGGIATGKSRIRKVLAAEGCHTLDLDAVAHELMAPGGTAFQAVVETFGRGVLDSSGSLDRTALGRVVFGNATARARLDGIIHPLVREEEQRRVAEHAGAPDAIVVTDAALLVEAGAHLRFDRLVVADCPAELQVERVVARDGLSRQAAQRRVSAQMPGSDKRRYGHVVIDTDGPVEQTERAAGELAAELRDLAGARRGPTRVPLERAAACLAQAPRLGPRGLSASLLLGEIVAAEGLELASLARRLVPAAPGPWYRAARPGARPGPEALMVPMVLWSLGRELADTEFLISAAFSLSRLTHTEEQEIADACWFALGLWEAVVSPAGEGPPSRPERVERVAGRSPSPRAVALAEAGWSGTIPESAEDASLSRSLSALRGLPTDAAARPLKPAEADALARLLGAG
jgi:dephospho-CoA kinase